MPCRQGRSPERGDNVNNDWTIAAEEVDDVLGQLPRANPDAARAQRVRDRCHRKLTRPPLQHQLEAAVVGGFCAVYLCLLTLIALRTHGLL